MQAWEGLLVVYKLFRKVCNASATLLEMMHLSNVFFGSRRDQQKYPTRKYSEHSR